MQDANTTRPLTDANPDRFWKPDNTPNPYKHKFRKAKKSGRSTPGAFGKSRFEELRLTNYLREQGKRLKAELLDTGAASQETRKKIDTAFGEGATTIMTRTLLAGMK